MSSVIDETLLSHLAFIFYVFACIWCFFNIIFKCWGFILNSLQNRFQNDASYQDTEPGGDIEIGEIRSNGVASRRIRVLPAVYETRLPIAEPKKLIISAAAGDKCVICLEGLEEKQVCWVLVKCDHVFHKPCLEEWFKINFSCPLCRTDAFSVIIDA